MSPVVIPISTGALSLTALTPAIVYNGYCVTERRLAEDGASSQSYNERRLSLVAQQTSRSPLMYIQYTLSLGSYTIPFITTAGGYGRNE